MNNKLSKFLPAGFYYKTFMWPAAMWMKYEHYHPPRRRARRKAPSSATRITTTRPMRTATSWSSAADRPALPRPPWRRDAPAPGSCWPNRTAQLGGALLSQPRRDHRWRAGARLGGRRAHRAGQAVSEDVRILPRTMAYRLLRPQLPGAGRARHRPPAEDKPDHTCRASACGRCGPSRWCWPPAPSSGRSVFADNDRPGIMLASACADLPESLRGQAGRKAVVFTNNDSAYGARPGPATGAGVEIAAIVDLRGEASPEGPLTERGRSRGPEGADRARHGRHDVGGKHDQGGPSVAPLSSETTRAGSTAPARTIACDLISMSGRLESDGPSLLSDPRAALALWDEELGCFLPDEPAQATRVAGACNGPSAWPAVWTEGSGGGTKGRSAEAGFKSKGRRKKESGPRPPSDDLPASALAVAGARGEAPRPGWQAFRRPAERRHRRRPEAGDLREGYRSVEHVKRYTTTGMGTDQGKMGNVNAIGIVARGAWPAAARRGRHHLPPALHAGHLRHLRRARRGRPARPGAQDTDPLLARAQRRGASRTSASGAAPGTTRAAANPCTRRSLARSRRCSFQSLGILDASTLGKIDIKGKDAAELLNRVYTNAWSKLEIGKRPLRPDAGRGRHGHGRRGDHAARVSTHFLMTTTTGNAALGPGSSGGVAYRPSGRSWSVTRDQRHRTVRHGLAVAGPNARQPARRN